VTFSAGFLSTLLSAGLGLILLGAGVLLVLVIVDFRKRTLW
jgi:hypothetical protein